ncbi:MAG: NAD-dependent epimerase/dehydratase family protein [Rhodospirillaceae bacterium]|nr:NAD-dependent epimerase/dehydratase family protein [Rhodospirillaceae bacterium]
MVALGKTYAVLGGGGSFGLHCAKYLLDHADPYRVVAIGRDPPKPECFTLNVGKGDPRYEYRAFHVYYEQDLLLDYLDRTRAQIVINFAAQSEGAASWRHSWRYFETNAVALAKLAEELKKRDYLERFIHIGTSEVYGSVDRAATEDDPVRPSSPYAASKAAFDLHLISVHRFGGFPMNILRPCNVYGPGQQLQRLIPRAIVCGLTHRKLPLHGGGRAEKSYIHVRDLARAILMVADGGPMGTVYNVGTRETVAVRRVAELCAEALGIPFDQLCEVTGERFGQDYRSWIDSSAIYRDLRWQPEIGWDDGLGEMVAWGRRYLDDLRAIPLDFQMRG